jgi:hypothetical protein
VSFVITNVRRISGVLFTKFSMLFGHKSCDVKIVFLTAGFCLWQCSGYSQFIFELSRVRI